MENNILKWIFEYSNHKNLLLRIFNSNYISSMMPTTAMYYIGSILLKFTTINN